MSYNAQQDKCAGYKNMIGGYLPDSGAFFDVSKSQYLMILNAFLMALSAEYISTM